MTSPLTNSIQLPFIQGEYTQVYTAVFFDVDPLFPSPISYTQSVDNSVVVNPGQHQIVAGTTHVPKYQLITELNSMLALNIPSNSYICGLFGFGSQVPFEFSIDIVTSESSQYQYGYYALPSVSSSQPMYALGMIGRTVKTRAPEITDAKVELKFTAL